ncbi:MAG: MFS transporter [Actinobacteria bacterium]|nr:MFS transporter [Actinomycetota bacterium]
MLGPVIPFLRAEQKTSFTAASFHFSGFALGGILVALAGERLAGRFGRRASVWGGGAGMGAGAVLIASSPILAGTVAGAFVMGSAGALMLITIQASLTDHHGTASSAAILESNIAASTCAIASSIAVGALAGTALGWRGALLAPACAYVALTLFFRLERPQSALRPPSARATATGLPRMFWALWVVTTLGVGVEWSLAYWGADMLVASGLAPSAAATGLSALFAAMVIGRVSGSRLARHLGEPTLLLGALGTALAGFLVFWLSGIPLWTVLGLFVAGLGVANIYPVAVAAATLAAAPRTEAATSRLGVGAGAAVLLAPLTLGRLADGFGIATAYGFVLPLLLIALATTAVVALSDNPVPEAAPSSLRH